MPALARTAHKWIATIVAVQAVLWTLTGVYMTVVHIDIIHGDRLVKTPPAPALDLATTIEPAKLIALVPGLTSARLEPQLGRPVYVTESHDGKGLYDARTGQKLSPLGEDAARDRAKALFAWPGDVVSVELLTSVPLEIQSQKAPIWRVEFEGAWRPTFYISPETGELVSRRHDLWRTFDVMWMFHIMDYDDRQDVNNPLIRIFTWMAVAASATGAWLLLFSFRRKRRKPKAA
jgi:hypothetical protein